MANNRLNNIMDKNWKTMSGILDKEMPVEKKKRGFWVWIFMIGIITVSIGIFISQQHDVNESIIKPTILETSKNDVIAANKVTKKNQVPFYNLKDKHQNPKSNYIISDNQISQTQSTTLSNLKNDGNMVNHEEQNMEIDKGNISSIVETKKLEYNHLTVNDINKKDQFADNITNIQLKDQNNESRQYINELEILPNNRSLILSNNHLPIMSISKASKTGYNLGFLASAATINLSSISSFFAGLQGEKKLSTPFSLYANLGWRQHRGTNINIQDESISLDKFELSNTTISTNQKADQELNQLIIRDITKTINYLELASGVKYQLSNSFSLIGGMNLGYLISESYEIDEETRGNYSELAKEYELNYVLSNSDQTNLHQKWTAHINVGIEARLSKSLFLYSNVHHLLNSYTNDISLSKEVNDNRNWLELGIKYNFIK